MLEAKDTGVSVLQKKRSSKIFSGDLQDFNNSKVVLSSRLRQGNFRGLEASSPRNRPSRPRTSKCVHKDSTSDSYIRKVTCFRLVKHKVKKSSEINSEHIQNHMYDGNF